MHQSQIASTKSNHLSLNKYKIHHIKIWPKEEIENEYVNKNKIFLI